MIITRGGAVADFQEALHEPLCGAGPERRERSHSARLRATASESPRRSRRRPHPCAICRLEPARGGGSDQQTLCRTSCPLADSLVGHGNPAPCQHLLDHAKAQRKPEIEPDCTADREAMAMIERVVGSRRRPFSRSAPSNRSPDGTRQDS